MANGRQGHIRVAPSQLADFSVAPPKWRLLQSRPPLESGGGASPRDMVLSDRTIREELDSRRIVIDPLGDGCIQPASVDLRLDMDLLEWEPDYSFIDVRGDLDGLTREAHIPDPAPYILEPGQFILASTMESVELPDDIVARLEGKSSLGRLGLLIHSTAGYVDPGWKGQLTLEISNVANARIALYYGMRISQISFLRLTTPAERPYGSSSLGSKYQGQVGPTASRSHLDFREGRRPPKPYAEETTDLRKWLDESEYEGSIRRLSTVLSVPVKTLEDWVYGRYEPNAENRAKLFEVTQIESYALDDSGSQASFLTQADSDKLT